MWPLLAKWCPCLSHVLTQWIAPSSFPWNGQSPGPGALRTTMARTQRAWPLPRDPTAPPLSTAHFATCCHFNLCDPQLPTQRPPSSAQRHHISQLSSKPHLLPPAMLVDSVSRETMVLIWRECVFTSQTLFTAQILPHFPWTKSNCIPNFPWP